jgi:hypothetical protein
MQLSAISFGYGKNVNKKDFKSFITVLKSFLQYWIKALLKADS